MFDQSYTATWKFYSWCLIDWPTFQSSICFVTVQQRREIVYEIRDENVKVLSHFEENGFAIFN